MYRIPHHPKIAALGRSAPFYESGATAIDSSETESLRMGRTSSFYSKALLGAKTQNIGDAK